MNDAIEAKQTEVNLSALILENWNAADRKLAEEKRINNAPSDSAGPTFLRAKDCAEYIEGNLYAEQPVQAIPALVHLVNCAKDHDALQLVADKVGLCADVINGIEEKKPGFFRIFRNTLMHLSNGGSQFRAPSNGPKYVLDEIQRQLDYRAPKQPGPNGNGQKAVSCIEFIPR